MRDLVSGKRAWSHGVETGDLKKGFRGWHEKGYLPHRDEPGLVQFITFRLADAFPEALRSEWKALMEIEDDRKRREQLETYLDCGRGECHLRRPDVAGVVERVILRGNGVDCEIRA